jgi:hypothetical protein
MARQLTEQQRLRARRDEKTLLDAGWALRRLADTRRYQGVPPYVAYALAGTLDAAAYAIEDVPDTVRAALLRVAAAITSDAQQSATTTQP